MPKKLIPLLFLGATLSLVVLTGCPPDPYIPNFDVDEIEGFQPIYGDSTRLLVQMEGPRSVGVAGKIYSYGNLLVINERNQGFHVFDNSDPNSPQNLFFISIPGNQDVAVKDGIVYADNYTDLLALEITMDTVIVLKRMDQVINYENDFPPYHDTYFECVDPTKGTVIGWQSRILFKPQCYRQ